VANAPRLTRLAAVPSAPLLIAQARRLRRETPRLPDAARPWFGAVAGPDPLRLLVLGDSTAAGVGAATQDEALPGNLARLLLARTGRGVEWRAVGANGANARDVVRRFLDEALEQPADIIFVSVGANDALGLRSRSAFGTDIRALVSALRKRNPDAVLLVSSLPAFFRFALLPEPLRGRLYAHSQYLEATAREIVAGMDRVHMSPPPPPYTKGFFASDLFHPSADGYRDWARFAFEDAVSAGVL